MAGLSAEADRQASKAAALLDRTPVDNSNDYYSDAESVFSIWLTTELQERFALAHEQMHFLETADHHAFELISARVVEILKSSQGTSFDEYSPFRSPRADHSLDNSLMLYQDHHLFIDDWYLHSWADGSAKASTTAEWDEKRSRLLPMLNKPRFVEEIVCDLFGALAVCLDSHRRQRGWTLASAAAACRVALESLGMVMKIDSMIARSEGQEHAPLHEVGLRAECMELVLPVLVEEMIPGVKTDEPNADVPSTTDLREILRLAGARGASLYGSALVSLESDIQQESDVFDFSDRIPLNFEYKRPSPDWKSSWALEIGVVDTGLSVAALAEEGRFVEIDLLVQRHMRGDWGDVDQEEAAANERNLWREFEVISTSEALRHRGPIFSGYRLDDNVTIFIKTEADRTQTSVFTIVDY
ncbi:hypothetical protein [Cryobacterium aureum]|uniref:hypothetical protein n=1 Tax=Cryobacterium aureum TaxID=995037 RepID=UPI00101ADC94|nr:hypothetical protein [Cryobacterium aureum]